MSNKNIYCVTCQKEVNAYLTNGKEIYPHRPDLAQKNFFKCPICKNFVGCHIGTHKPLGCIPRPQLKKARIKAHNFIDQFWKNKKCSRTKIYKILSDHFGYRYHNGNTKTVEECEQAIKVIKEYFEVTG